MHTETNDDDDELVNEAQRGNEKAFARLIIRYQSYVYAIALNYVTNKEDAEDIVQETFIKLISSLKSFKKDSKFSTWLYSIVYFTCIDWLRKRKGSKKYDLKGLENLPSDDLSYNILDKKTNAFYIQQAFKILTEEDSTILTLFYYMDQSLQEIASIMKISNINTMKVKLFRARKSLKTALDKLLRGNSQQLL
jgi:RNA polymerase sigma-70 factor (ECF subfamily)